MLKALIFTLVILFAIAVSAYAAESACYGVVGHGRLENSVQLPAKGKSFSAYSPLGVTLGRTYLHSQVATIVLAAYAALELSAPGKKYVYGETGWASGGRFRPHRTHQNGLSVDFFVPVVNNHNQSVILPMGLSNKFGYNIEFDSKAKFENYTIDFEAMAEHLYQLHLAAKAHDSGLALVIFDRPYLPQLFATKRGNYLKENINFMQGKAWVRHDEHYHVDFSVTCKPIAETTQ